MANAIPTRDEAMALLREFNQGEGLVRHALAVEAVMRHMARKRGADPGVWGIVGLSHDLDYEWFPDQHCAKTAEILRDRGWPEEFIRAAIDLRGRLCLGTPVIRTGASGPTAEADGSPVGRGFPPNPLDGRTRREYCTLRYRA